MEQKSTVVADGNADNEEQNSPKQDSSAAASISGPDRLKPADTLSINMHIIYSAFFWVCVGGCVCVLRRSMSVGLFLPFISFFKPQAVITHHCSSGNPENPQHHKAPLKKEEKSIPACSGSEDMRAQVLT